MPTRKLFKIGIVLIFLLLFCGCVLGAAYFFLPTVVERTIIPALTRQAGLTDFTCQVRHIGLSGADLSDLKWGQCNQTGFCVENVQLDYTPQGLFRRHVRRVRISGIKINLALKDGRLVLPEIDLSQLQAPPSKIRDPKGNRTAEGHALIVEQIQIRNAALLLTVEDHPLMIPMEIDITPPQKNEEHWRCNMRAFFFGRPVNLSGSVDIAAKTASLSLDVDAFNPEHLAGIMPGSGAPGLSGRINLNALADVAWDPFELASLDTHINWHDTRIQSGTIAIAGPEMSMRIGKQKQGPWKITLSHLGLDVPIPANLAFSDLEIDANASGWTGKGKIDLKIQPFESYLQGRPIQLLQPMETALDLWGEWQSSGGWQFNLETVEIGSLPEPAAALQVRMPEGDATAHLQHIRISGGSQGDSTSVQYELETTRIKALGAGMAMKIPKLTASGKLDLTPENSGLKTGATYQVAALNTMMTRDGMDIRIPSLTVSGKISPQENQPLRTSGTLVLKNGHVRLNNQKVAEGIYCTLPYEWPEAGPVDTGRLSVNRIRHGDLDLGDFRGKLRQENLGWNLNGSHTSRLLKGLAVRLTARADMTPTLGMRGQIATEPSHYQLPVDFDPGLILPAAQGVHVGGVISGKGDWAYTPTGLNSTLKLHLREGRMAMENDRPVVEGIETELLLTDLINLESAPHQQLKFKTARHGDIVIENGVVDYQIQPSGVPFIENSAFQWCGGSVNIPAVRLGLQTGEYNLVLYCDRINLARLLEQIGAAQVEGGGTLSGKIPIQYKKGQLTFADGFLYTSPGEGGKIRLTGGDMLLAGVDPATAEQTQIELAIEAMKDYDYDWVKLNMTTEAETLILKMQMNGKPAKPLPFTVDAQSGRFKRVGPENPGSVFQGISLDVNFRLPLNQLLRHGKTISEILN
jgi:Dicarboxylate transport